MWFFPAAAFVADEPRRRTSQRQRPQPVRVVQCAYSAAFASIRHSQAPQPRGLFSSCLWLAGAPLWSPPLPPQWLSRTRAIVASFAGNPVGQSPAILAGAAANCSRAAFLPCSLLAAGRPVVAPPPRPKPFPLWSCGGGARERASSVAREAAQALASAPAQQLQLGHKEAEELLPPGVVLANSLAREWKRLRADRGGPRRASGTLRGLLFVRLQRAATQIEKKRARGSAQSRAEQSREPQQVNAPASSPCLPTSRLLGFQCGSADSSSSSSLSIVGRSRHVATIGARRERSNLKHKSQVPISTPQGRPKG